MVKNIRGFYKKKYKKIVLPQGFSHRCERMKTDSGNRSFALKLQSQAGAKRAESL